MATVQEFVASHSVPPAAAPGAPAFEVQNERTLKINLGGHLEFAWIKMGSMVARTGAEVKFNREGAFEHGFTHWMKKALTSEGADLVRASTESGAPASLFLADQAKSIILLRLVGDSIVVNGNDLLAFEPSRIKHDITMMRKVSSVASAGLFNVRLEGRGFVAILAHGKSITLPVVPGYPPVYTDPQATVAWSGNLAPDFHIDVNFKTLIGRSSGESFQMKFVAPGGASDGGQHGFVIVQPYEEVPPPTAN